MRVEAAIYYPAILPENRGNPLIEALPVKLKDADVIEKLSHYPLHSDAERDLPELERVEYLTRLRNLRQPQPVYLDLFRAIEVAIKESLSVKNPFSPSTMNYLSYPVAEPTSVAPVTGYFQAKGCGITVIGESGVGKTSMLEQILNYFPDTIVHSNYKSRSLPLRQVVWVKVDCPENSSVRGLCHKIITELDRKLELPPSKFSSTINGLTSQIEARVKSCFLGILVIDEMQNLNLAKTGGDDRLIAFLHNLVNYLGIPLLFCANPPFNVLLAKTLKTARRAESNGYFDVEMLKNDEMWELFVDELWRLQWTNVETPLTVALRDKLFYLSVGNMELAMRIYREAQRQLIGTSNEMITEEMLDHAAACAIRISNDHVNEIRKQNSSIFKRKEIPLAIDDNPQEKPSVLVENNKLISIPIGLNRTHHPEFANKIIELTKSDDLYHRIKDPDLLRRTIETEDPIEEMKKSGVFCSSPLQMFR